MLAARPKDKQQHTYALLPPLKHKHLPTSLDSHLIFLRFPLFYHNKTLKHCTYLQDLIIMSIKQCPGIPGALNGKCSRTRQSSAEV